MPVRPPPSIRYAATRRWRALSVLAAGLFAGAAMAAPAGFDIAPVQAAVQRLLPRHAAQIDLVATSGAHERYRIDGGAGQVRISGDSPSALLVGVNTYLHDVAHVDIGLPGSSTAMLPPTLPAPAKPIEGGAVVPDRFALNDTDDGYSNAFLDWDGWQHKIDLLALHGINEVFMPVGAEEVYRRTFKDFGYTDAEIRAWIPDPAHQPWWLLQNMCCQGAPMSPALYARRVGIAQRIVARMRELGMTPVFPGYYGTVPTGFRQRQPRVNTVSQGMWVGFQRPDWLDPREPMFGKIAAAFYRHQRELYGDSTLYKMDLLHEGGKAGNVPPKLAAQAVWNALHAAHPNARWVLLGWQNNPTAAEIEGAGKQHLLIVDGLSDRLNDLDRETQWQGAAYAFGSIPNFGGHFGLGANVGAWMDRYNAWRGKPGSALRGIAYLPEGVGTDPAAFDVFTSLAWTPVPTDRDARLAAYADYRYGGADPHASAAWKIMADTDYAMPAGEWSEAQDSLFAAKPDLKAKQATPYGPERMRYDGQRLAPALGQLLQVAPTLRGSSAYRFDLVNLARQVLADRSRVLLPQLRAAYEAKDRKRFGALSHEWLADMRLLDRLLASDEHTLLDRWLAPARAAGGTPAEAAALAYQQLTLINQWADGAQPKGSLQDYANREYADLVGGLYLPRWQRYFTALDATLASDATSPTFDWVADAVHFARHLPPLRMKPEGDAWALAAQVADRLGIAHGGATVSGNKVRP